MKNCGRRFHNEVGKYRFLNELIKLVSPKVRSLNLLFGGLANYFIQSDLYLKGNQTPTPCVHCFAFDNSFCRLNTCFCMHNFFLANIG